VLASFLLSFIFSSELGRQSQPAQKKKEKKKKKKKDLIACRGLGRAVGPLLAARALPLRCAASTGLSSTMLAI
jgi:hypothetical protein